MGRRPAAERMAAAGTGGDGNGVPTTPDHGGAAAEGRQDRRPRDGPCVDGTFWTDDEMIALGLSKKTARGIGHLPQSGPGGMVEWDGPRCRRARAAR